MKLRWAALAQHPRWSRWTHSHASEQHLSPSSQWTSSAAARNTQVRLTRAALSPLQRAWFVRRIIKPGAVTVRAQCLWRDGNERACLGRGPEMLLLTQGKHMSLGIWRAGFSSLADIRQTTQQPLHLFSICQAPVYIQHPVCAASTPNTGIATSSSRKDERKQCSVVRPPQHRGAGALHFVYFSFLVFERLKRKYAV